MYLDPFAGTGKIHRLEREGRKFVGIELEREWADMDPRTLCADSLAWMEKTAHKFDGVVTSPVYGNRMSDHHNARDASKRHGYKFSLGHDPTEGSSATMYFWEGQYKAFHVRAWQGAYDVTRDGGMMFLNVKNFYRTIKKERHVMPVVGWHMKALQSVGWRVARLERVTTPGMREGENRERFDGEVIIVAFKPGMETG